MPKKKDDDVARPRTICLTDAEYARALQAKGLEPGKLGFSTWGRMLIVGMSDKSVRAGKPVSRML